jgi:hypothetical protein
MYRVFICKAAALLGSLLFSISVFSQDSREEVRTNDLRVILIRHAEKPAKGYNLTCQGLNRSLQLVPVLHSRFGIPSSIYVPTLGQGDTTKHARMFQTIVPFAATYNLLINTGYQEDDTLTLAHAIHQRHGTVFVVWEHSRLAAIARCLGVHDNLLHWRDDDYDSIWVVTFHDGKAVMTKESEGLHPGEACSM